jgi:hypothetical protein
MKLQPSSFDTLLVQLAAAAVLHLLHQCFHQQVHHKASLLLLVLLLHSLAVGHRLKALGSWCEMSAGVLCGGTCSCHPAETGHCLQATSQMQLAQ